MTFSLCVYLTLLLVSFCCGGFIANANKKIDSPSENFQKRNWIFDWLRYELNSTEFMDLNEDCLILIFEQLDLPDLANVAQINEKFHHLANTVFKRKFPLHIHIAELQKIPRKWIVDQLIEEISHGDERSLWIISNKIIYVYDYDLTLNILKYFGGLIKQFDMKKNLIERGYMKTILIYIDKYCASSLIQLDIGVVRDSWLELLKGPFKKLEDFTFDLSHDKDQGVINSLSLNETFPNLRRFSLENWNKRESTIYLNGYLPHLEFVKIERTAGYKQNPISNNIFNDNSHIRSLEISGFPGDYIKTIHELLKNLENLTIGKDGHDCDIYINEPIHFEHLKVFDLRCYQTQSLTKLSFSNLQMLEIYYDQSERNKWIEFFRMNQTFTRIKVQENHVHDQHLIEELPKSIVEISMSTYGGLHAENILRIMDTRKNLTKLQFNGAGDFDLALLKDRAEKNWYISTVKGIWNGFLMIRNNATIF